VALILAVLNEPDTSNQLISSIVGAEHDIIIAHTFRSAFNTLMNCKIDLVICDIGLFENNSSFTSGFDFLSCVKHDVQLSYIPFVCFTVKMMINQSFVNGVRTAARALGAESCIAMEQFDNSALEKEVKRLLDRSKDGDDDHSVLDVA